MHNTRTRSIGSSAAWRRRAAGAVATGGYESGSVNDISSLDAARQALRHVVSDGQAPNGIQPADCGAWAETVQAIYDAHARGGTAEARTVAAALAKAHPPLARLLAGESEKETAGGEWGGVLPFHSADLPPFPLDILPHWLRAYVESVTETMQTPPDLAGMLALAVLSTACAQLVEVRVKAGWEEPVNIFVVMGLPPGTGKSPVFRAMMAPIVIFERKKLAESDADIMAAEMRRDVLEQRIQSAKSKAAKTEGANAIREAYNEIDEMNEELRNLVIPKRPKYVVDDITPETVATTLADQGGRVAVMSSEGDIFAIMAGRYSSAPNIGVYKKGHAGDELRVDRRNRSEYVPRPAITMGITTQPEVMRSFGQNAVFRSEGLLARFFYALPRSTVGNRKSDTDPIPDTVKTVYYHRVLNLFDQLHSRNNRNTRNEDAAPRSDDYRNSSNDLYKYDSNNTLYIEISEEGRALFFTFKDWLEPQLGPYGAFNALEDWANKLPGGVLRIAGLLHMAEQYSSYNSYNSYDPISEATIAKAIRFAHYLIPHAQAAYAEIGADPAVEGARRVLRWIEKTGARSFTKQQCYQGVKGTLKRADDLDPVLSLLCDHGYLREIEAPQRSGPGRKAASSYDVHPIVFAS